MVQTVELGSNSQTVALGFGAQRARRGRAAALAASAAPFAATYAAYQAGWRAYDARAAGAAVCSAHVDARAGAALTG